MSCADCEHRTFNECVLHDGVIIDFNGTCFMESKKEGEDMTSLKVLFEEAMRKQNSKCATNMPINRSKNKTGFKWLCKTNNKNYKNGYGWVYHRAINNKNVCVYASDLFRLFEKVVERGYDWIVLDESRARSTVEAEGYGWNDFIEYMESHGGFKVRNDG